MKILGIIPARGGSKSVPLKNIRKLDGKPLLAYAIESAQQSQLLSRTVVSTDYPEIAAVAEKYGCEIIMRASELAADDSLTEEALIHALEYLREKDHFEADIVLTLEPTSPFRTSTLIDKCIAMFNASDADSVIGVVEDRSCYGKILNGRFQFLFPEQPRRRQEREPLYQESSTIYATRTEVLLQKQSVLGDNLYPLIVSKREAIDINTETDFLIAESFIKSHHARK